MSAGAPHGECSDRGLELTASFFLIIAISASILVWINACRFESICNAHSALSDIMMRGDGGHLEGICGRGLVKTCSESFSFAMASEGLGAFGLALPNKCILIQSCCCKIQMALSGDCSSLSEFGCNHKQLCAFTSQRRRAGPAKRGRGGGTERARERGQSQNEGGTQLPSDRTAVCCGDAWGGGEGNRDAEGWTLVLTGTGSKTSTLFLHQ